MNSIWLVRHGATQWTVERKHTGRTDLELLPEGEREARALGQRLGEHDFELVLTSPLARARLTAELAGFPDAQPDPDLVEIDYGDYEGRTSAEIREERPGWLMWNDGNPGGESPDEAGARADRVIARIGDLAGDVLVFGHGHLSRILAARFLGLPASEGRLLMLRPAAVSVIGSEHGRRAIESWNC